MFVISTHAVCTDLTHWQMMNLTALTRLLQQLLEVTCSSLTSADPSGFITFWREISLHAPITLQKTQSAESLAYFCMMIQHCVNFSTASYEFLMKPKESTGCHQTLSSRVGSGYETSHTRLTLTHVLYQGIVRACIYGDCTPEVPDTFQQHSQFTTWYCPFFLL